MTDFVDLAAHKVSKYYGAPRDRFCAVRQVSLDLKAGAMVGIVGESGSGKSTLIRLLLGLVSPTDGTVSFNGNDVSGLLRNKQTKVAFRRTVQFVPQDTASSFDPMKTLRDAVRLPAMRLLGLNRQAADKCVDTTLETLSIPPALADRYPREVSGGQRQRFAIARAVVIQPRFLVCDEAVSALDVSVQGSILNLLKDYCETTGAGVAFVSHSLPATAFIANELVVMHRGDVVERGPTQTVLERPNHPYTASLIAAYLGQAAATADIGRTLH
jgi:ABC-type oligopeptide transport system ATPase subunit